MNLIYEFDLDILKRYLHAKNELSKSRLSKVRAIQTDRHTNRQMLLKTLPRRIRGW